MGQPSSFTVDRADRVVAFDLETTGLDATSHRIVEFSLIVLDRELEELDRWSEVLDPGMPIPQQATEVHGLSDADVAGKRTFQQIAPVLQAIIDDAVLMAYNHSFDKGFLHAELVRAGGYGILETHPFIDPMHFFKRHVPDTRNTLTEAVAYYLGQDLENAHRAEQDTEAMVEVFRVQRVQHPDAGPEIEDALVPYRRWLDPDRKLYEDAQGTVRYGFGKHDGHPVVQHPGYAEWMIGADFKPETKKLLREVLDQLA